MRFRKMILPLYLLSILAVASVVFLSIFGVIPFVDIPGLARHAVLGEQAGQIVSPQEGIMPIGTPVPLAPAGSDAAPVVSPAAVMPQLPSGSAGSVGTVSVPRELNEGDTATFTWFVSGSADPIKTTTIYMGKISVPGTLDANSSPSSVAYTDWLRDFIDGSYKVPLNFTAGKVMDSQGQYYGRAYAEISGKHVWGNEFSFVVHAKPKNEITIVNPPAGVKAGEGATFTWDITGPPATTWYTVIVYGKQSRPGPFDDTVTVPQTPYTASVNDFSGKEIHIPLRFIAGTRMTESGVYYFRAVAVFGNKNIWSDEHSFTVE